jgi:hypothetical protein
MAKILDYREDSFQTTEFTGKLISHEVRTVGKSEKEAWVWSFEVDGKEDPLDLALWDVVPKAFPDGTERYNNKRNVGRMIQSLISWGISIDKEVKVFKLSPDLVGKTLTLTPCDQREYTKDDEKKLGFNWEIKAIQGMNKKGSSGSPAQGTATTQQPAPKVDANTMLEPFYEWMVNNVKTPMTEAQISKKIIETKAGADYNKVRRACLIQLSSEKDGRVFQDLIDEKNPKYSVA